MNLEVAKKRYKDVFLPDVIDNTDEDFLAKHVPMKHLYYTDHATILPQDKKNSLKENEIYDQVFIESDDDQFVLVKGASGAGKSHLIRWLYTMFSISKSDADVVLYVKRADNTLKGTIKQLIELPEIKNMPNQTLYKKLTSASTKVSETEFKNSLYYGFVNLIDSDERSNSDDDYSISHVDRKHLVALMQNSIFKEKLLGFRGPIDRIYTKIAENNTNEINDAAPQFEFEDFQIDSDIQNDLMARGADIKALKLASKLIDNDELTNRIVAYVNSYVERVVQLCTGLEAGDLRDVIEDIRQELYRQNKTLTILIEDISAASGVDDSLLDALLTNKAGYPDKHLCRINSVVGVADGYFDSNIRTNTKGRIKKYVLVPDEMFDHDENGLVEFVARYLNTVSLEQEQISEWINNQARPESYPIHTVTIGDGWGEYKIGNKAINLFPFTKHAILFLYKTLDATQRNPRSLMRLLIEPYVNDALNDLSEFPTKSPVHESADTKLVNAIYNRTDIDDDTKIRLRQFMSIWGDGTNSVCIIKGIKYIAGIPESVYAELNLPVIDGETVLPPVETPSDDNTPEIPSQTPPPAEVSVENKQVSLALKEVDNWIQNKDYKINFGATTASVRALNYARNDINKFLFDVIDWASEGVSADAVNKIEDKKLVSFERQTQKSASVIILPANIESRRIIEAFVKWRSLGSQSWDFPGASDCLYVVQRWTNTIKNKIVAEVLNYSGKKVDYLSYAMAAEYYRLILNGYCRNFQSPTNFTPDMLLQKNPAEDGVNGHTKLWNDLKSITNSSDGQTNRRCVLQYFNLVQGTAKESTNYEIDYVSFCKAARKVIGNGLKYTDDTLQLDDPIQKRKKISEHLKKILDRVDRVVEAEKESLQNSISLLSAVIEIEDIDEDSIKELLDGIKRFYDQATKTHVSIALHVDNALITSCKKNASSIANAIKTALRILTIDDPIESLIKLSKDPLYTISSFSRLLEMTNNDIAKADDEIAKRMQNVSDTEGGQLDEYSDEKKLISECKTKLERLG